MKRAIVIHKVPDNGYLAFSLEVRAPGILRTILTGYEPPSAIITAATGTPADVAMVPSPALVFEVDPEGALVKRAFVWLPAGKALTYEGTLTFVGTYVEERTGLPLLLYEASTP